MKNAGKHSFRKTKKRMGKMAKSRKRLGVSKGAVRKHRMERGRENAPKMRKPPKGWMKANSSPTLTTAEGFCIDAICS